MKPKQKIVQQLIAAGDVVSGETLSAQLGVSRVSVWKHIKGLVQSGMPIVSSPKGYRLVHDPDGLMPWEFGDRQDHIHYFPETTSTMDEAMTLARAGCPDFSVAIAQRQTRGRGRMRRNWMSDDGGLYFTVVVRPDVPIMQAGLLNLAAALEMADLLRSRYGVDARLKWPNDILVADHKICGLLSQMEAEGEKVALLNIGVGLNVNNAPETEEPIAVSLKALLGRAVPRREILTAFLDGFEACIAAFDPEETIEKWRSANLTIGRRVRVVTVKERVEGTAEDVDAQGGLIVRLADGTRKTLHHGDCFHR